MKYVLAKLTQYIELTGRGSQPDNQDLCNFINPEVDIEHILPRKPANVPPEFRDRDEYDHFAHRLGNLILVEKTINTSISNEGYDMKKEGYKRSKFLLTKSIAQDVSFGKDTRMTRVSRLLRQYPDWGKEAIEDRQRLLSNLSRLVWGVD